MFCLYLPVPWDGLWLILVIVTCFLTEYNTLISLRSNRSSAKRKRLPKVPPLDPRMDFAHILLVPLSHGLFHKLYHDSAKMYTINTTITT